MRDPERGRAQHALKLATEVARREEQFQATYRSYVDRLCGAIVMNGLGQAIATENAAAGDSGVGPQAHGALAENVESWLTREGGVYPGENLMDAIVSGSEEQYLRAHMEALAWLVWHKKFCHAYLRKEGGVE